MLITNCKPILRFKNVVPLNLISVKRKIINSFHIIIFIRTFFRDNYRVVGFEVETLSVNYKEIKFEGDICNFPDNPRPQQVF